MTSKGRDILMKKYEVTNKELDVLKILWASKEPLTAKDIHTSHPNLVLSTVQISLKKLIKKNLVEIKDIVYSGTVLTRSYAPLVSEEAFVIDQYEGLNMSVLLSEFLGNSSTENINEELNELEEILRQKKQDLQ